MKQKIRILELFLIPLFVLPVLVGCSRKEKGGKKVVITYAYCEGLPNMIAMNNEVIANFERENPDIKIKAEWGVNFQKHLTQFAGGSPPDVSFWPWGAAKLVSKDVLLPLNDLIGKHGLDTSQYFECIVDQYTYHGKIYLIPQQVKTIALMYNKDIFDKFSVPYPDENWTWDDYYETAKRLTIDTDNDGKRDYYGTQLPGPYHWICLNDSDIFDYDTGKSLLKTERTREALEFVVKLYRECCPSSRDIQAFAGYSGGFGIWSIEPFLTGKIAMVPAWAFMVRDTAKINKFRWDVVPIPKALDGERHHIFDDGGLCIAKNSKHPDEAFRFIKYYCSREGMIIYGRERNGVPAHIEAALETFPVSPHNLRCYVEAAETARPYRLWIEPTAGDVTKDFGIQMDLVLLEEKSLDDMIRDVSSSMERNYEEFLRKGIPAKLK